VSEDSAGGAGGLLAGLGPGSRVGGYRLEEQVGAGGMAVVFRAVDERLGRRVALKVLAPAFAADTAFQRRFLRESRAAAAVDDPHIIPVHEAGEVGGVLFIAMRFVPGGDVRSLLAQAGPLAPARAAAIISPVASALDAAHAAGLVHRDVKPANMLVDVHPDRPDHVYLSDFGLSKGTLASTGLTGTGQYLGTPDYMAPEQIEGRAVDGRTDQYALACAAFELLCGQPPFRRDQGMAVLFAHLQQQPPSLASILAGLPTAVDAVFTRALAKNPADRYPTCRQFADEVRQALGLAAYHSRPGASPAADQPPAAHPATEIAAPAMTPVPLPEALRAALDSPLPAVRVGAVNALGEWLTDPDPARTLTASQTLQHIAATDSPAVAAAARALIPAHPPAPGAVSPAAPAQAHGRPKSPGPGPARLARTLKGHAGSALPNGGVLEVAFSRDGQLLATSSDDQTVRLWDPATGQHIRTLTGHTGWVNAVAFSPDGLLLAAGAGGQTVRLWNPATGGRLRTLTGHTGGVRTVAFSRDGRLLASGSGDQTVRLWNPATGECIGTLTGHTGWVNAVAFSPDGQLLATGAGDKTVRLWNPATGQHIRTLTGHTGWVNAVAFSPDGQSLASGSSGHTVRLWNPAAGEHLRTLAGHTGGVQAVAFSPDGQSLASGSGDQTVRLWNPATGECIGTLTGHTGWVNAVAFSPDGQLLATGAGDQTARLWHWSPNSG
jgi:eukaryotic-like serine/threonine-protein kinase